jgi:hypothetical protein
MNERNETSSISDVPAAPPMPSKSLLDPAVAAKPAPAYKKASEDLSLVDHKLYIGCLEAACNVEYLKSLNITHILTVEDHPLDEPVQKGFTYKFIRLFDLPSMNILDILEECIEFIDGGVQNGGGVLVHWYILKNKYAFLTVKSFDVINLKKSLVGMSRSASIVIGYLMAKNKKSLKETIEYVRQNRAVRLILYLEFRIFLFLQ